MKTGDRISTEKKLKKKEQYLETEENVYEVTGFKKEI